MSIIHLICVAFAFLVLPSTESTASNNDFPTLNTSVALSYYPGSWQCREHRFQQFRTLNGFCNNLRYPSRGAAGRPFIINSFPLRHMNEFKDFPTAREISNMLCDEVKPKPNARGMSELVTFFGQLLDHTFVRTGTGKKNPLHIKIPKNDPVFRNHQHIPFFRTKKSRGSPINELSSYIDASSVYGTNVKESTRLREMRGGRLKLPGNLLPRERNSQFLAGDTRSNENPNLMSIHLLFAREHNVVAAEVSQAYPYYNDEQIYQLARHIVAAEMQAITYYEFIPALTGQLLPKYRGYNPSVRAIVSNVFTTVAFRVGHTMLNRTITSKKINKAAKKLLLRDVFFKPKVFIEETIDGLLRGMMSGHASEIDNGIVSEVRNFLMDSPNRKEQLDLASLNIQRGRDHGVPSCNDVRRSVGLPPFRTFHDVVPDETVARNMRHLYDDEIDDVDAIICGICEAHVPGSSLGAMFHRIIRRQFQSLRDGDRFYFERPGYFKPDQKHKIATIQKLVGAKNELGSIMSSVIVRNTGISENEIKCNPFFV